MTESSGHTRTTGQWLVPAALVLPLALVGLLLAHGRRAELAQRQLVDRAMADYSEIAAWQFAQHSRDAIHHWISRVTSPAQCVVGVAALPVNDSRTNVQYDFLSGSVAFGGEVLSPAEREAVLTLLRSIGDGAQTEPHRLFFGTIGERMRVVAVNVIRDRRDRPGLAYGAVLDTTELQAVLDSLVSARSMLPGTILESPLRPEHLRVRLSLPDDRYLFTVGRSTIPGTTSATDTIAGPWGGLRASLELDPEIASRLLLPTRGGGYPMPMLVGLSAIAFLLAGLALIQLRRSRELARLRGQFVANVSHELRTPLTHISMFAETLMLARERSPDERRRFATVIHREARRLTNLVEGVMRFSRIDAGRDALHVTVLDASAEVQEALDTFQPMLDAAAARLVASLPDGVFVLADAGALRQVVVNLLDNAVKFGPRGQTIEVSIVASGSDAMLSVTDQGPGIPAAQRQRVFEPFTRLTNPSQPRTAGAGIGLAVVADLVAKLKGSVGIADRPSGERGAIIWVQLPLARASVTPVDLSLRQTVPALA